MSRTCTSCSEPASLFTISIDHVSDGKVLTIANQQFKGLSRQAGAMVKLTGS